MRRSLSVGLVAGLVVVVAACNGGGTPGPSEIPSPSPVGVVSPPAGPALAAISSAARQPSIRR